MIAPVEGSLHVLQERSWIRSGMLIVWTASTWEVKSQGVTLAIGWTRSALQVYQDWASATQLMCALGVLPVNGPVNHTYTLHVHLQSPSHLDRHDAMLLCISSTAVRQVQDVHC